jgi:hypothetical protein
MLLLFVYILETIIRMVYKNGDSYAHACNQTPRNAVIYFECDPLNVNERYSIPLNNML